MTVQEIATNDEFVQLLSSSKEKLVRNYWIYILVIIDFNAEWCGPCKIIGPVFHALAEAPEYKESVIFASVNVDNVPETAAVCGVTAMPTFQVRIP